MAEETEKKEVEEKEQEIPRWKQLQQESITRATVLIKEHGADVEFLVIKDKQFLTETVRPIENIDTTMDYIYRLEGRGVDADVIQDFRREYQIMCGQIKKVENLGVEALAKAGVRTRNISLNRKIQKARKVTGKSVTEEKEEKTR